LPTFKEQQESLVKSQHTLAVWEFLYAHLDDNYISKDGRNVEKALRVPECLIDIIPEDTIDEILTSISADQISVLRSKIEAIQNQELVILDKEDNDGKK